MRKGAETAKTLGERLRDVNLSDTKSTPLNLLLGVLDGVAEGGQWPPASLMIQLVLESSRDGVVVIPADVAYTIGNCGLQEVSRTSPGFRT